MNSQEKISSERSDSQPSSAGVSPANLTAVQENVKRLLMNVTLRENSSVSFGRLNPDGSLLKMSQGSVQANLEGFLENSFMTFPKWGILSGGVVGKLPMSEPRTEENGSSLLPTMRSHEAGNYQYSRGDRDKKTLTLSGKIALLPTPTKSDYMGGIPPNDGKYRIQKNGTKWGLKLNQKIALLPTLNTCDATMGQLKGKEFSGTRHALKLEQAINLLPTPTSRDHKDTGNLENVPENALLGRVLGKRHGLKLQPAFAEWMMGFSVGWTDLEPLEMPLFLNKRTRSSKQSQTSKGAKPQ